MTIRFRYVGDGKAEAVGRFGRRQCDGLAFGTILEAEEHKPRSLAHHNWWFATLAEKWETLSDDWQAKLPSPEALRAYLLVKAGWCESRMTICETDEKAAEFARELLWADPLIILRIDGPVVFAFRAKSQAFKAQNRKEFVEVTERALHVLAGMLGCDAETLRDREAA